MKFRFTFTCARTYINEHNIEHRMICVIHYVSEAHTYASIIHSIEWNIW